MKSYVNFLTAPRFNFTTFKEFDSQFPSHNAKAVDETNDIITHHMQKMMDECDSVQSLILTQWPCTIYTQLKASKEKSPNSCKIILF